MWETEKSNIAIYITGKKKPKHLAVVHIYIHTVFQCLLLPF